MRDVEIVRQTEGGAHYYYGLLRTRGTSGVLGLANGIPARTAIGVDEGSTSVRWKPGSPSRTNSVTR